MRILASIVVAASMLLGGCSEGGIGGTGASVPPIGPTSGRIGGQANKGPFADGATVQVLELQANGTIGGELGSGSTLDLGSYNLEITSASLVAVTVTGNYFSERLGDNSEQVVALDGYGDPNEDFHVNVATHLISDRVRQLMVDGNDFDQAESLATSEMLLAFESVLNAPADALQVRTLVLLNGSEASMNAEGNAWLLALSSILDEVAGDRDMQAVLDGLREDLADDGLVEAEALELLIAARGRINPDNIHSALLRLASGLVSEELASAGLSDAEVENLDCEAVADELSCAESSETADNQPAGDDATVALPLSDVVADMNLFLDTDGDGEPNATDDDDDNDGVPDSDDDKPYTPDESGRTETLWGEI